MTLTLDFLCCHAVLCCAVRPTAEQLLKHHWFTEATEGKLLLGEGPQFNSNWWRLNLLHCLHAELR
jgi:hypothetical protein